MRKNPLVNEESHFTAFLAVRGCEILYSVVCFILLELQYTVMAWAKQAADAGVGGMQEKEVVQGVVEGSVHLDTPDIPDVQFIKVVSTSI